MNADLKAAFRNEYKKPSWKDQFDWDNIKFYFRLSFKTCAKIGKNIFNGWRKKYE